MNGLPSTSIYSSAVLMKDSIIPLQTWHTQNIEVEIESVNRIDPGDMFCCQQTCIKL